MSKRKIVQSDLAAFFGTKRKVAGDGDGNDSDPAECKRHYFSFDFESEQINANEFKWSLFFDLDFHTSSSQIDIESGDTPSNSKLKVHIGHAFPFLSNSYCKIEKIASDQGLRLLMVPTLFETCWSEFTFTL